MPQAEVRGRSVVYIALRSVAGLCVMFDAPQGASNACLLPTFF